LQETQQEERTRIILNMVVDLAKQLQMIVVSEGVENKDQVDYLTSVGCDIFQGFYFERPISVADFEERYF
jgi:EAL domain-containing protein (putative c-di-GMP-specific phosphodiesterase class I)